MGFSRQEYWSGLPFPSPEDLPDPGIEPESPVLQADSLPSELQGTVWRFLKKLKMELPYDPAIPLLDVYPEKNIIQKETLIPIFIAVLFTIAIWQQSKCPSTGEWIKMWYIYTMEHQPLKRMK